MPSSDEETGPNGTAFLAPVYSIRIQAASSSIGGETRVECDSHADTSVVGKEALIIHDYGRPVSVYSYDKEDGCKEYRTVSAAVAYDHPQTGQVYMLVINQAIEIPHLEHHLLCPMQCRLNGIKISELPKFLAEDPDESTHSLQVVDPLDDSSPLFIPLSLTGVTSYFQVRKPTIAEWENEAAYPHIDLTAEEPIWDPQSADFSEMEDRMIDFRGQVMCRTSTARGRMVINSLSVSLQVSAVDVTDDENFGLLLESKACVLSSISKVGVAKSKSSQQIDHMTLSKKWGISPEKAKQTIQRTTQRGIRTVLHPSLSRRFRTNDRALRYRRLPHPVFGDTLIAGTTSLQGNKYAEVFATSFGWSRAFPMQHKSDAHEALSLLFQRDGVPPACIVDGSLEQVKGEFRRKLKEASCRLKQTEPYSPWQNAAEGNIRELKKGAGRKMIKSGSPKKLWDDCLVLESYIRSNTAHDIYMLHGEVPETIMSGETSDISQFCEFEWYEWVKFRDSAVQFPEDSLVLGRYLGPSIDVGPALTAKILKQNGEVVHRSTTADLHLRRL